MADTKFQVRRLSTAVRVTKVFSPGEPCWDLTEQRLYVGDGETEGGVAVVNGEDLVGVVSEQYHLFHAGVPFTGPGAGPLMYFVVPANGRDTRTIKRMSVFAQDISNLSGTSVFDLKDVTLEAVNVPFPELTNNGATTDFFATSTVPIALDTSGGDMVLLILFNGVGGHGNITFQIEVE